MTDDRRSRIQSRAYAIWEEKGRPEGGHQDHWRQAAAELGDDGIDGDESADAMPPEAASDATPSPQGRAAAKAASLRGGPQKGAADTGGSDLGSRDDAS